MVWGEPGKSNNEAWHLWRRSKGLAALEWCKVSILQEAKMGWFCYSCMWHICFLLETFLPVRCLIITTQNCCQSPDFLAGNRCGDVCNSSTQPWPWQGHCLQCELPTFSMGKIPMHRGMPPCHVIIAATQKDSRWRGEGRRFSMIAAAIVGDGTLP